MIKKRLLTTDPMNYFPKYIVHVIYISIHQQKLILIEERRLIFLNRKTL